jgi:hypothetical protein
MYMCAGSYIALMGYMRAFMRAVRRSTVGATAFFNASAWLRLTMLFQIDLQVIIKCKPSRSLEIYAFNVLTMRVIIGAQAKRKCAAHSTINMSSISVS